MNPVTFLTLILLILHNGLHAQTWRDEMTPAEMKEIRRARCSPLAFYHGRQMKEFVRLMNLARSEPALLEKYISARYGEEKAGRIPKLVLGRERVPKSHRAVRLRPSFGLHMSALYHSVGSGVTGYVGHGGLVTRVILGGNVNPVLTRAFGENCSYGNKAAIDSFLSLLNSPGHCQNILNKQYMRVGVSRNWHSTYGTNTVTVFSGPKFADWVLSNNDSRKATGKRARQ